MFLIIKVISLAILFVVTGGALFASRFRRIRLLAILAGIVALTSSVYLARDIRADFMTGNHAGGNLATKNYGEGLPIGLNAYQVISDKLRDGSSGPNLVVIPAGGFAMQPISPVIYRDIPTEWGGTVTVKDRLYGLAKLGIPQVQVQVGEFAIGSHEITFEQYDYYANQVGRPLPSDEGWGRGERPVINISRADAKAYLSWLSLQTGRKYRLPRETEWEYVARATTTTAFNVGDSISLSQANFSVFCVDSLSLVLTGSLHSKSDQDPECPNRGLRRTAPVGSYKPNFFGLWDVHGNVREWIDPDAATPASEKNGEICRGGSWDDLRFDVESTVRETQCPGNTVGFRVAREL